jgi:hypothetical protein
MIKDRLTSNYYNLLLHSRSISMGENLREIEYSALSNLLQTLVVQLPRKCNVQPF